MSASDSIRDALYAAVERLREENQELRGRLAAMRVDLQEEVAQRQRLREWIAKVADDWDLAHSAGRHGRRVWLEASRLREAWAKLDGVLSEP